MMNDEQLEAGSAAPKIPPMGKLDIPARGVPLNECHSCGWLGGENEVPGEEDQCYCPNCRSDNIDDDVNLPRLFDLVRYLARAALATQPAEQLWAVHAQGPDDLYAAFSREEADAHADALNALPCPPGISVSAIVIESPWTAADHWKYLVEQDREHTNAAPPAAAPVAAGEPVDGVEGFACWLIDHCEGYEIFEEKIQDWVADYLKSDAYQRISAPPAAAHGDEAVLWIECDPSAAKFDRLPKDWQFWFSTNVHQKDPGDRPPNVVFPLHSGRRAQAGEGGE